MPANSTAPVHSAAGCACTTVWVATTSSPLRISIVPDRVGRKKFGETAGNFEALINSVTVVLAELQRQIQAQRVRTQIADVLDKAGNVLTDAQKNDFLDTVKVIENTSSTPIQYARDVRNAATKMQTQLTELLDKKASDPEFIKLPEVANLQQSIEFATAQRTVSHDAELAHFRKVDRTLGGGLKFNATTGRG